MSTISEVVPGVRDGGFGLPPTPILTKFRLNDLRPEFANSIHHSGESRKNPRFSEFGCRVAASYH
jgi:hypothetical protein